MEITVIDFTSLDGVVQAPGGPEEDTDRGFAHGGWSHPYFDPEVMGPVVDRLSEGAGGLLFGRRTWQGMAAAWPGRAGDPFADRMNALPKHVASRTLTQADLAGWSNSALLPADRAVAAIAGLRETDGGPLLIWGSSDLAGQLIAADLVDRYVLMVEPVVLGGGKRLFPDDGRLRPLELLSVERASTGVLVCTYRPSR